MGKFNILAITYNIAAKDVLNSPNIDDLFDRYLISKSPALIVLCIQEFVKLNTSQFINTDTQQINEWSKKLILELNKKSKTNNNFILLTMDQMFGIVMFAFCLEDYSEKISEVMTVSKKTGAMGLAGNKGAVILSIKIFEETLCFVGCHFASGQNKILERNKDYETVYNDTSINKKQINDHNSVVFMGDLNYRINLDYYQTLKPLNKNTPDLGYLLTYDQVEKF